MFCRTSEFALKLTDIDAEQVGIPETEYSAVIKMPSAEFARVCRDLSNFGESVSICATKDGLAFAVKGDSSNGKHRLAIDSRTYCRKRSNFYSKVAQPFCRVRQKCLDANCIVTEFIINLIAFCRLSRFSPI